MARIGIADYGLGVWYGGNFDYSDRLEKIKAVGYEGIESLAGTEAAEVLYRASILAEKRMGFGTVNGPTPEQNIRWTAAMGGTYVWANVSAGNLDDYIRCVNYMNETCNRFGVRSAIHNHLGSCVETQDQLDRFLRECPDSGLLLDIGHLGAAGGNVFEIFDRYADRICAVHLKDWKTDPEHPVWMGKGRFCGLGEGELVKENEYVVKGCLQYGFNGWIFVEQDTHLRDPMLDLRDSRNLIRSWGI